MKNWTRMGEGTWRHDLPDLQHARMNIYADYDKSRRGNEFNEHGVYRKDKDREHISEMDGTGTRPDHYDIIYTTDEGKLVLATEDNKQEARKKATSLRGKYQDKMPEGDY